MRSVLDMCDLRQLSNIQLEMFRRRLEIYVAVQEMAGARSQVFSDE